MAPQGVVSTARDFWQHLLTSGAIRAFWGSLLFWDREPYSGHPPHLHSWYCLGLLCSPTSRHGPQASALASWFLELL